MLGASLCMLLLVSTFVAFGSWPGENTGKEIDQVLLNEVAGAKKAEKVAVGTAAIKANRRAALKRQIAIAREEKRSGKRSGDGTTADGDPVAKTPAGSTPTTAAGTPVAAVPGGSQTVENVRQQTQDVTKNVTQNLQQTTQNVTQNVTQPVQQTVDQTTTQVGEVVDQVVGGVQQTTSTTTQQVQSTVDNTTKTLTNTVGGVLGK
jgi:hypothetical protein